MADPVVTTTDRRKGEFDMAKKPRWKVIHRYICRSSKDPESMARGVGLGLFVGFLPSFGFQIVLALFLAGFFNANRITAMLGTLVTNPFTTIPLSVLSIWVGDWILPGSTFSNISAEAITAINWSELFSSPGRLGTAYLLGCLTLSLISSLLGYSAMKIYFANSRRV